MSENSFLIIYFKIKSKYLPNLGICRRSMNAVFMDHSYLCVHGSLLGVAEQTWCEGSNQAEPHPRHTSLNYLSNLNSLDFKIILTLPQKKQSPFLLLSESKWRECFSSVKWRKDSQAVKHVIVAALSLDTHAHQENIQLSI